VVYRAPNVKTKFAASMVFKEYKSQTLAVIDFAALAAMPALVEDSLSYAQAERLISIAAWPCALVEDNGSPTGFVMPAIPDEFFIPLTTVKGVSTTTAEFQHLLNHPTVLEARGIDIDDAQRYTLLRETASALTFLHKHGVCVGDISPKNLLFSLTPHEAIYFIDCDAMRINTVSALPQLETPGWDAPAGEELATIYTDTYKLGLLALRLLAGDHDTKNPNDIPATTPTQLRQIITDTLTNAPAMRPLPEAWTYVLGHAIEQAQHQTKLAAAPAPAAPTPAPVPQVRSRPAAHPAPPVRPSAPPIPTVHSRPRVNPPPREPAPTTPQPWWRQLGPREIAIVTIVVVILAGISLTFKLLQQNPRNSETPAIATPSAPTAQPAPSSTPPSPTSQYLKTQWGTACEVTAQQVTCQVCIPGSALPARQTCSDPAAGRAISTGGTIFETAAVTIDSSSEILQISNGETYHVFGWTIEGSAGWARFINDATGHGAALAAMNYSQI
jgi:serine/threonine protein kinase